MRVHFRRYTDADAEAVIDLIKEAYGNGYIKQKLYDGKNINEYNKSGFLRMTVAVNEDNKVIGVVGREKSAVFKNQCELVTQILKKEYRGMNLSQPQLAFQVREALDEEEHFTSLYARILAHHTKAQRVAERLGFISCGFMLNIFDAGVFTVSGLENPGRLSQTVTVLPYKRVRAGTLYIPPEIGEIVCGAYKRLNAEFQTGSGSGFTEKTSLMAVTADKAHKCIEVCVYKPGADFFERMAELEAGAANMRAVNLYLNIRDKGAVEAYRLLREKGFIFTGIQPLNDSGEFVIMHNPLGRELDMGSVAYIKSQNPFAEHIRKNV